MAAKALTTSCDPYQSARILAGLEAELLPHLVDSVPILWDVERARAINPVKPVLPPLSHWPEPVRLRPPPPHPFQSCHAPRHASKHGRLPKLRTCGVLGEHSRKAGDTGLGHLLSITNERVAIAVAVLGFVQQIAVLLWNFLHAGIH
jgi:hypothetical protein